MELFQIVIQCSKQNMLMKVNLMVLKASKSLKISQTTPKCIRTYANHLHVL